mmetsp:Transcript_23427/g.25998  ORF Transcript_23427/g.25998 Transcript_23427/m.25998 type:complete len:120 (-) Transcript_23427:43-402(-)
MQASKLGGRLNKIVTSNSNVLKLIKPTQASLSVFNKRDRSVSIKFRSQRLSDDKINGAFSLKQPAVENVSQEAPEESTPALEFWEVPSRFKNLDYEDLDVDLILQGANDDINDWNKIGL